MNYRSADAIGKIMDSYFKTLADIENSADRAHAYSLYIGKLESIISMTAAGYIKVEDLEDKVKDILK